MNNRRIGKHAIDEYKTVDKFIEAALKKPHETVEDYKMKLEYYKESLKELLPDFTIEEIMKMDEHFMAFKEIYRNPYSDDFLSCIAFEEHLKSIENEKSIDWWGQRFL